MDILLHGLVMIGGALCVGWLIAWLLGSSKQNKKVLLIQELGAAIQDAEKALQEAKDIKEWQEGVTRAPTQARPLKTSSDESTESDSRSSTPSNTHSGR